MEKLLDLKDGAGGLLASICVILALQVLIKVGEFLWNLKEKKDSASEAAVKELTATMLKNTEAIKLLDQKLGKIEGIISEIPKFKLDVRRMFSAVKILAGEKWTNIRKEIMKEDGF